MKDHDPVHHPRHYTLGGIECIDAIEAAVYDKPATEAFLVGQVIKYVWRYNTKNGVQDLEKARWYLDRLINHCVNKLSPAFEKRSAQEEAVAKHFGQTNRY